MPGVKAHTLLSSNHFYFDDERCNKEFTTLPYSGGGRYMATFEEKRKKKKNSNKETKIGNEYAI